MLRKAWSRIEPTIIACAILLPAGGAAAQRSGNLFDAFDASAVLGTARETATRDTAEIKTVEVPARRGVPRSGHAAEWPAGSSALYNIWSTNCHLEANFFAANAAAQGIPAGILACQGNPESSPAFHTANWAVTQEGQTCLYNWGERCCWASADSPPDIRSGPGEACARWACGGQYDPSQTRALPAGQLVESPGPNVCAVAAAGAPVTILPGAALDALTDRLRTGAPVVRARPHPGLPEGAVLRFDPERLDPCLACCGDRAELWEGAAVTSPSPAIHAARQTKFRAQCETACRSVFGGGRR